MILELIYIKRNSNTVARQRKRYKLVSLATSYHNVETIHHSPPDGCIIRPSCKIKVNVYKDKLIVQCINSLPALPILAYNFDDLDRDQPKILVSFATPVCHVMQTYRLIVKASKIFETNYRKMR